MEYKFEQVLELVKKGVVFFLTDGSQNQIYWDKKTQQSYIMGPEDQGPTELDPDHVKGKKLYAEAF